MVKKILPSKNISHENIVVGENRRGVLVSGSFKGEADTEGTKLGKTRRMRSPASTKQGGAWPAWKLSNGVAASRRGRSMARQRGAVKPDVMHGKV
jgi:hypothetical protein